MTNTIISDTISGINTVANQLNNNLLAVFGRKEPVIQKVLPAINEAIVAAVRYNHTEGNQAIDVAQLTADIVSGINEAGHALNDKLGQQIPDIVLQTSLPTIAEVVVTEISAEHGLNATKIMPSVQAPSPETTNPEIISKKIAIDAPTNDREV